jgi:hypothetical protein
MQVLDSFMERIGFDGNSEEERKELAEIQPEVPKVDYEKAGIIRDKDIPFRIHLDEIVEVNVPMLGKYTGFYRGLDGTTGRAALYPYVCNKPVRGALDILEWEDGFGPNYIPIENATFKRTSLKKVDIEVANENEKRMLQNTNKDKPVSE